jgi:hypothetical protein
MDHIPVPSFYGTVTNLQVPLLTQEGYDHNEDFKAYPDRQGWHARPISEWEDIFESASIGFQGFLQRWLYFGTIEVISGQFIDVADFSSANDYHSSPYLSTSALFQISFDFAALDETKRGPAYAAFVNSKMVHQSLTLSSAQNKVLSPTIRSKTTTLFNYITTVNGEKARMPDPRNKNVVIADEILHEYIFSQVGSHLQDMLRSRGVRGSEKEPWEVNTVSWVRIPGVWELLIQKGWCQSSVLKMAHQFNTSGLLFLSHMRPSIQWKEHTECSRVTCKHLQMQDTTYETKHADGCQGCVEVFVDVTEVADALESGTFPVILPFDENDESPSARITPWFPDLAFVAISHVWSDGLGNVHANSLPRCQMMRLTKLITKSNSPTPCFWVDTLCVPPDEARVPALQGLAIDKMRDVYEQALYVLVLDSWLISVPQASMSATEALFRIFSCTWNQRLWTYQEAALAPKLQIAFRDSTCDIEDLIKDVTDLAASNRDFQFKGQILRLYGGLRHFRDIEDKEAKKLVFLIDALRTRSTSVSSDEALCLSTLMGMDTFKVFNAHPSYRMQQFWAMLDYIPSQILDDRSPKLTAQGYHWAPKSFLLHETRLRPTGLLEHHSIAMFPASLYRDVGGLHVQRSGMRMSCGKLPIGRRFYVKDAYGAWYDFTVIIDEGIPNLGLYKETTASRDVVEEFACVYPYKFHGTEEIAYVFDEKTTSIIQVETLGSLHVLQSVSNDGTCFVTKIGTATRKRLEDHDPDLARLEEWDAQQGSSTLRFEPSVNPKLFTTHGSYLPSDQEWCII